MVNLVRMMNFISCSFRQNSRNYHHLSSNKVTPVSGSNYFLKLKKDSQKSFLKEMSFFHYHFLFFNAIFESEVLQSSSSPVLN